MTNQDSHRMMVWSQKTTQVLLLHFRFATNMNCSPYCSSVSLFGSLKT